MKGEVIIYRDIEYDFALVYRGRLCPLDVGDRVKAGVRDDCGTVFHFFGSASVKAVRSKAASEHIVYVKLSPL